MKHNIVVSLLFAVIILIGSNVYGEEVHGHNGSKEHDGEIQISKDTKKLLSAEMHRIQAGMGELIVAIPAADWETIAAVSTKIKESYILKQKLTKEQMEELHNALPPVFIEMDQSFHATAGRLAQAAREHNGEIVNYYFYKLNESCVLCHGKYAKKRFPSFGKPESMHRH